jgi:hypothetical protein
MDENPWMRLPGLLVVLGVNLLVIALAHIG